MNLFNCCVNHIAEMPLTYLPVPLHIISGSITLKAMRKLPCFSGLFVVWIKVQVKLKSLSTVQIWHGDNCMCVIIGNLKNVGAWDLGIGMRLLCSQFPVYATPLCFRLRPIILLMSPYYFRYFHKLVLFASCYKGNVYSKTNIEQVPH